MDKTESHPFHIDNEVLYDFTFLGLGAGNSLLLLALLKKGCFANKKVAVIEPEKKNENDKTYCFWASPNDAIIDDLKPIISHYYDTIVVNQSVSQSIEKQPYYFIKSIDLYTYLLDISINAGIPIFRGLADNVFSLGEIYGIHTSSGVIKSRLIFDSRPPSFNQPKSNDIYLNQSFYGMHIKCEKEVFKEHSFEMMNFNVDQNNFTQFIYTLPFSSRESLVELTRFGTDKIELNYAKEIVAKKIKAEYGNYEVIAEETGCIPMTTCWNPPNVYQGVLHTGASANLIKPSTGYGFKNMYHFAAMISDTISKENFKHLNQTSIHQKKRFRFYDTLLLIILLHWPQEGKKIFTKLFKSQNIYTVFSFLDEKTSMFQECKIFASLPLITFLKSLFLYMKMANWLRYLISCIIVLIYFAIGSFSNSIALAYSYFLILIGLLFVGIPHGAVDHLLKIDSKQSLFRFVGKYLLIIIAYFILWQYFPLFALIFFILYSSFHFGESELQEMELSIYSVRAYLKSFLLGASILFFIIFTHLHESINILSKIDGLEFIASIEDNLIGYIIPLSCIILAYLFYGLLSTKKDNYIALFLLLLLGTQLPLIFAFSLYFICQHSYNAWGHIQHRLSINSVALYKKALPFTLGALSLFIAILFHGLVGVPNLQYLISDFFIFLACISLPHFLLMHLFYKKKD